MGVSCTVKDNGGPFSVSASLKSPATNPQTGKPINPTLVILQTTIQADQTATGTVTIQDDKTISSFTSVDDMGAAAPTCLFNLHKLNAGDQLDIAPGRLWAGVT